MSEAIKGDPQVDLEFNYLVDELCEKIESPAQRRNLGQEEWQSAYQLALRILGYYPEWTRIRNDQAYKSKYMALRKKLRSLGEQE
jgi:hypothetical protein